MFKTIFTTCCLGLTMLASSTAQAQTAIAQYEFNNPNGFGNVTPSTGASAFAATTADPNLTAGSFEAGFGFNDITVPQTDALLVSEFLGLADGTDDDLAGAVAAGEFVSVTLTANDGFALDLDSLTFEVARAANGAQDYAVFSDVTGFAAADAIAFGDNVIPVGPITSAAELQTVDLSSTVFDGLDSIEFRVVYDDRFTDNDPPSATVLDTFTVNGSVVAAAVPEPSAIVVLGLGSLGMLVRRRK